MGDRATQECDPSTVAVPYGMGLVSLLVPTLYNYAGCSNAINSSPARGCFLTQFCQLLGMRTKNNLSYKLGTLIKFLIIILRI